MPCKGCEKQCKCTPEKCDEKCKCSKDNKCNCHGNDTENNGTAAKSCCSKGDGEKTCGK